LTFLLKEGYVDDMQAMARDIAIASGLDNVFRQEGWQVGRQEGERKGRQEGWQEGRLEERRNIFEFLRNGHTLEEAEKEFALT